jgi:hypothetical protein
MDDLDREELIQKEPNAAQWLRPFVGGEELISGKWRWCLWLKNVNPSQFRKSKMVEERLERVRSGRLKSKTESVKAFAKYPTLFTQDRQPNQAYLAIPEVSSATREYIPMSVLQRKHPAWTAAMRP